MKNLFRLLFVCALFALTSCKDNVAKCETDFAGTYTGTETCSLLFNTWEGDLTEVIITGSDDNYKVNGENASQEGCTLTVDKTVFGLGTTETITISENTLTLASDNIDGDCIFTGTR